MSVTPLSWRMDSKTNEGSWRWLARGNLGAQYVIVPYTRADDEGLRCYAELEGVREVGVFRSTEAAMSACQTDFDEWHGAANGGGRGAFLDELINLALGVEADQYEFYDGYVAEWLRGVKAKRAEHPAMLGHTDEGASP